MEEETTAAYRAQVERRDIEYRLMRYDTGWLAIHATTVREGRIMISKYPVYPVPRKDPEDYTAEVAKFQKALELPILERNSFGCWDYAWINWD